MLIASGLDIVGNVLCRLYSAKRMLMEEEVLPTKEMTTTLKSPCTHESSMPLLVPDFTCCHRRT